jgi:predicted nucleotidyltransferase
MENITKIEWANRYSDTMEDDFQGRWARIAYAGIFDNFGFVDGKVSRWDIAWITKVYKFDKFQIRYKFPSNEQKVFDDLEDAKKEVEKNFDWFIKSCVDSNVLNSEKLESLFKFVAENTKADKDRVVVAFAHNKLSFYELDFNEINVTRFLTTISL